MITSTAIKFSGGDFNQTDMVSQIVAFAKKSPNLFGSHGFYLKTEDFDEVEETTYWTDLRLKLFHESNQVLINLFENQCTLWQDILESASTPIGALKIAHGDEMQRMADELTSRLRRKRDHISKLDPVKGRASSITGDKTLGKRQHASIVSDESSDASADDDDCNVDDIMTSGVRGRHSPNNNKCSDEEEGVDPKTKSKWAQNKVNRINNASIQREKLTFKCKEGSNEFAVEEVLQDDDFENVENEKFENNDNFLGSSLTGPAALFPNKSVNQHIGKSSLGSDSTAASTAGQNKGVKISKIKNIKPDPAKKEEIDFNWNKTPTLYNKDFTYNLGTSAEQPVIAQVKCITDPLWGTIRRVIFLNCANTPTKAKVPEILSYMARELKVAEEEDTSSKSVVMYRMSLAWFSALINFGQLIELTKERSELNRCKDNRAPFLHLVIEVAISNKKLSKNSKSKDEFSLRICLPTNCSGWSQLCPFLQVLTKDQTSEMINWLKSERNMQKNMFCFGGNNDMK